MVTEGKFLIKHPGSPDIALNKIQSKIFSGASTSKFVNLGSCSGR